MAKKRQSKNQDYLKITLLGTLITSVIVTLAAYWNSYSFLNTISTSLTVLGFSLLAPLSLFIFVFWLKMLVDATQKQKWIWFALMIIGNSISAILYFFIEKPKLTFKSFKPTIWVGIVLFVSLWLFNVLLAIPRHPLDLSKLQPTGRQFEAKVTTKDLIGYTYRGPTTCHEEKLDDGTYYMVIKGGTVTVNSKSPMNLNYRLGASGDSNSELSSGWQSYQQTQPQAVKYVDVAEFVGNPSEISGPLNGCTLELWSSNN